MHPNPEPPPELPPEAVEMVSRYLGYGWSWPRIAQLVSRMLGRPCSAAELKELYDKHK